MEKHFVITNTQREALMQWISQTAKHLTFEEVSGVLSDLAKLPQAEFPQDEEKTDRE